MCFEPESSEPVLSTLHEVRKRIKDELDLAMTHSVAVLMRADNEEDRQDVKAVMVALQHLRKSVEELIGI